MKQTKVFGIKEKDFYKFIKKINQFYKKEDCFSMQTFTKDDQYHAIIYFKSEVEE